MHASVIASFRSPSISAVELPDTDSPVSARRASEMYSGFAGIVSRIA